MLITGAQFACQHLLARLVIGLRRLRNGASAELDAMTWQDWWQKGEVLGLFMTSSQCWQQHLTDDLTATSLLALRVTNIRPFANST